MGPSVTGLILLFIAIGVNSQDDAADSYTVIKETGICEVCVCTKAKVNCNEKNLSSLFSLEEWTNLTDINPTKVDLSYNYITTVTAIAQLPLEELDLSKNMIESIDNAAFRDLANLRVLDLSFNRLTSELSPHAFEGHYSPEEYLPLTSMRVLNLSYNAFHSLNQDLFEHLPELTSLDLTGNPLTTIDQGTLIAISSLPMLKELRLRHCRLSEIPDQLLHTPRYLERLDLSDNLLTSVPQALAESKNLVYLNLSQNPIEEIDMEMKVERRYICIADGMVCTWSSVSNGMSRGFPRLPKLRELHMCNMPELTRIGQGALGGLEGLAILHLSFNPKLSDIHPTALARPDEREEGYYWPIIKELYLQSNNLSKIDRLLVGRWDQVEKMDISGNPFLCDCSNLWMMDFLVLVVETTQVNGSETPLCQEPKEMRGIMQYLDDIHRSILCVDESEHEVMIRPRVDEVLKLMNLPGGDEVMDQPERDRVIVPGTYIDILPWMFLAVPILLPMMLTWRRKSSRRYDKLALAEENYI